METSLGPRPHSVASLMSEALKLYEYVRRSMNDLLGRAILATGGVGRHLFAGKVTRAVLATELRRLVTEQGMPVKKNLVLTIGL